MPKDYGFERYEKFRPTAFDTNIDIDREDWYVMPVSRNRDSDCLTESNFDQFLKGLGGESRWVEVHRFGHWANGWFEIIIVSPTAHRTLEKAYDMARGLQNYPVLDDEDFSRRESEQETEDWQNWGYRDFSREVERVLECEMTADDCTEPADPKQRWCKNWGLDIDVCGCGDCIETREEWFLSLKERVENFDTDQLRELADYIGMTTEHSHEGTHFRWKLDNLEKLIEGVDSIKEKEVSNEGVVV